MNQLQRKLQSSPVYARVMPFFVFCVITTAGGLMGGDWKFWLYAAKVFVGAWLIWQMRPFVTEMRWAFSWEAIVVGVVIFVAWVGLDPFYTKNNLIFQDTEGSIWNPFVRFGDGSVIAWTLICVRIFGMTIIVPPLEEVFYRSFLYRYIIKYDFQKVAMGQFDGIAFVLVSLMFGAVHFQWLPGIICAMAYQWLVIRKGRLGDAMTAHAITNFLLGVYVVWKGGEAWKFF